MATLTRRRAIAALAAAPFARSQSPAQTSSLPHYWSLLEVGERIRRRDVSPVELLESQLARIGSLDPKLNAFQVVLGDSARVRAREAEGEIRAGRYRGRLHGVPIALKDLL